MGLAAMYLMSDELEDRLPIPKGAYDLPVVITDKMFAADGKLMYDDEGHSGLYGDVMLVNGQPWPNLKVARRKYRFRILNASLSRGLRLQLSNSAPDDGHRHRRRPHAQAADHHPAAGRHGRALRGRHRLRPVPAGHAGSSCATWVCRTPATSTTPTRSCSSRSPPTPFDAANNEVPAELNPQNEIMLLDETQVPRHQDRQARPAPQQQHLEGQQHDLGRHRRRRATRRSSPTRSRTRSRSGRSPTSPAAGSTPPTSTWSTSRSSRATARRPTPTSSARRTSRTSGRTNRCG